MPKKRLAIVGNGMATSKLLDDLISFEAQRRYTITVYGEEPGGCYNRILLGKVLTGADPDAIQLKPAGWYQQNGVELVRARVDRLDPARRMLRTADQQEHAYDAVVLATGSNPFVPRIENLSAESGFRSGAFIYRTLDDVLQIRSSARPGDNAVVLGGGLLGLEAAKALSDLGLHVTIVHLLDTLMNQQLDKPAGLMLQRQIERLGMFVRTGRTVKKVLGDARITALELDDGTTLPADLLVLACGIRPRVDLARDAGVPVRNGVLVNDALATSVPGVYALGECAEHDGKVYGIVAPIWEQAQVLAGVLSGAQAGSRYRGSRLYARLKVAGVEVASMGLIEPELPTDQIMQVVEERKLSYRKLILRDGRLIGAVLVGDTRAAGRLVQQFDAAHPVGDEPLALLCDGPVAAPAGERMVCNCRQVSEARIEQAIADGAATVQAIGECTGAGTGCGSCRSEVARLISLRARPVAVTTPT